MFKNHTSEILTSIGKPIWTWTEKPTVSDQNYRPTGFINNNQLTVSNQKEKSRKKPLKDIWPKNEVPWWVLNQTSWLHPTGVRLYQYVRLKN